MSKRIVYLHAGDFIELRFCRDEEEATARGYKNQSRPQHTGIAFPRSDEIEIFDTISNSVWSGVGPSRRQMTIK